MYQEENQCPDLTAFEAALASLAPRVDGFDRERLFFLAGQASVASAGDRRRSRWARWGWPAAFSAMTAIAASLLVMLCARSELSAPNMPTVAIQNAEPNVAASAATANTAIDDTPAPPAGTVPIFVARGHKNGTVPFSAASDTRNHTVPPAPHVAARADCSSVATYLAMALPLPEWLTAEPRMRRATEQVELTGAASDADLREQVLRDGVESRPAGVPVSAGTTAGVDESLSYRELLDRLLEEQRSGASKPALVVPSPDQPSVGARRGPG